jgi:hypothetical protein
VPDLAAHVARVVAVAPPLTDDQATLLRQVLTTPRKTPPGEPTGPSHQTIEPDATGSTTSLSTAQDGGGHG